MMGWSQGRGDVVARRPCLEYMAASKGGPDCQGRVGSRARRWMDVSSGLGIHWRTRGHRTKDRQGGHFGARQVCVLEGHDNSRQRA